MSELYELPKGWEWRKLGEVGKFIRGVSYKKYQLLKKQTSNSLTLLRANNIQNKLNLNEIQIIPREIAKNKIIEDGDILFAMSSGSKHLVGKNILLTKLKNYTFGAFCSIYRNTDKNLLDNTYLSYLLQSSLYRIKLSELSMGANINNLKSSDLENLDIPLPPLKEQKRIVAKLDSLFERIDKAIFLLEENIKSADNLMPSVLDDVFLELETRWEKVELSKVVKIIGGGTPSKKDSSYWNNGTIKWATVRDMNVRELVITENKITEKGLKYSSSNLLSKEAIIIATRVGLGKVCYLKDETAINQDLKGLISLNKATLEIKYIFNFFLHFKKTIISNGVGATVKGVRLDFIKSIQIPLPPLNIQKEKVAYLDSISEKAKILKTHQIQKLDSLKKLKASILGKAFKGEL